MWPIRRVLAQTQTQTQTRRETHGPIFEDGAQGTGQAVAGAERRLYLPRCVVAVPTIVVVGVVVGVVADSTAVHCW